VIKEKEKAFSDVLRQRRRKWNLVKYKIRPLFITLLTRLAKANVLYLGRANTKSGVFS